MEVVEEQELIKAEVDVKPQGQQVEVGNNMYSNNAKYEWLIPVVIVIIFFAVIIYADISR